MTQRSPDWFLDWKGQTAVIVASGPSAKLYDYELYRDRAHFIATNESWRLVPWAEVIMGADGGWWRETKGLPEFKGLKTTLDFNVSREFDIKLLKLLNTARGITVERPGMIGMGRNSGFYAANLAVQFKATKLILAGFDMNLDNGIHWHGPHKSKKLNNPRIETITRWRKILDGEAKTFEKLGVRVINVSPSSSLKAYPKMTLQEAFES